MNEHPLFRMWKDRLDEEDSRARAPAARRAEREAEEAGWYAAWVAYKGRGSRAWEPAVRPNWWNVVGWALWLLRLHAPGRPN